MLPGVRKAWLSQVQWRDTVEARFFSGAAAHQADGQELVQLRQGAQRGYSGIKMRSRTKLDIFLPILHPCVIAT